MEAARVSAASEAKRNFVESWPSGLGPATANGTSRGEKRESKESSEEATCCRHKLGRTHEVPPPRKWGSGMRGALAPLGPTATSSRSRNVLRGGGHEPTEVSGGCTGARLSPV